MIWKYIIRDLNGAIQYLPYGVMAGAVMGLILNAMNARRSGREKKPFRWQVSWCFLCTS